ncbi:polysaccharide deacetylase [Rhodoligotrophos ferricapiens]|uniref:polysaccharide deacetylase n=1 Tax=Rhodoligotrophos ferricapiens TaxID=3069264 RepID=UPI00315DB3CA
MSDVFTQLLRELEHWDRSGWVPRLWIRDDDAVRDRPELRHLMALCAEQSVPLCLAVVPGKMEPSLCGAIFDHPPEMVDLLVHGLAHENHEGPDTKKAELGEARPLAAVARDTARALDMLGDAFPDRMLPVLVPPWNRVRSDLISLLRGQGYRAISTFGKARFENADLVEINTHIDLIDWRERCGRSPGDLGAALAVELRSRRLTDREAPVGLLTHHAVHDERAWNFLEGLIEAMQGRVTWHSGRDLFNGG